MKLGEIGVGIPPQRALEGGKGRCIVGSNEVDVVVVVVAVVVVSWCAGARFRSYG